VAEVIVASAFVQQSPVIVRIIAPPKDSSDMQELGRVIVGALGLTGAAILVALLAGVVVASVLFWVRSRSA
jgi:hypothetical protein